MGPDLSHILAAAWAVAPLTGAFSGTGQSKRPYLLAAWSAAGAALAAMPGEPYWIWWFAWMGIMWLLEIEYRTARKELREAAELPAVELRRRIEPLEEQCRILRERIDSLQSKVSSCVGRYLAMKDFHLSLQTEVLARAVIDKIFKLTNSAEAAVGVFMPDGKPAVMVGVPEEKTQAVLQTAKWVKEDLIEGMKIRLAVNGENVDEALKELVLPLPTLWRQSILYARVEEMAIVDRLTGLYVRRLFDERLHQEMIRAAANQRPLSLILIDVDHFKQFNDTFGHLLGDAVLTSICRTLAAEIRKIDFAARYGGEEMTVILPETPLDPAVHIAERIRKAVENVTVPHEGQSLRVTASFGVAEYSPNLHAPADFVHRADQALYHAKSNGRNRVEVFSGN